MSTPGSAFDPDDDARRALTLLIRESGRDVLATLARTTGDLALAEDAVQDATLRAMETWSRDGVPANPIAWLRLTARRRAIDLVRREANRATKEASAMLGAFDESAAQPEPSASMVDDDLLRLIFTCCHPSLAPATQVSLALHTLCGLTTPEVARALLVSEASMAKRLTRARQKIARARIPYRVPPDHELPARWAAVLATTYLVFNEGYAATSGSTLIRTDLLDEALRLARLLHRLQPDDAGAIGLLALLLLHDSRREGRLDRDGGVVLLEDQDRRRWDTAKITEGVGLLGEGLRRSRDHPDSYVVQAAIAACHALAPTYDATDWDAIVSWYDVLLTLDPGPVVQLNRAVAIAERSGPDIGLAAVDAIAGLDTYALWHAARGQLLRRLGRELESADAHARAVALGINDQFADVLHSQITGHPD